MTIFIPNPDKWRDGLSYPGYPHRAINEDERWALLEQNGEADLLSVLYVEVTDASDEHAPGATRPTDIVHDGGSGDFAAARRD